jgi:hypothetical protein
MNRTRRLAFVIACVAAVSAGGGCTLLVSFDDLPAAADAGPTPAPDAARPSRDSAAVDDAGPAEAGADGGSNVPATPACDTEFPLGEVEGCASFIDNAQVCADNASFTSYPGDRATDVVTCSRSAGATCVRHCVACAHNPKGFPDQCDQCSGKPAGTYCGTEMGWQPENFKLLVTCSGGKMTTSSPCTNGCDSKGGAGAAACK